MKLTKLINADEDNTASHLEKFALDVLLGLTSNPKRLPAKYFYDDKGSEIFQKITQHPDYYLTKTEFEILDTIKSILPSLIEEQEIDIIELGAGDGHKSRLIIDGFLDAGIRVNFYPIDISEEAMIQLDKTIHDQENLFIHGVVAEYFDGLKFIRKESANKKLVLFLGSNIGNFDPAYRKSFLRELWQSLDHNDHVLIGLDLKKNIELMVAAYNDSAGNTKQFNFNLLTRINRELGANFILANYEHYGSYNPILGAMESYLLPIKAQSVYIEKLKKDFNLNKYEAIHLEYSFKFNLQEIEYLGASTGFNVVENFADKDNYFTDTLWMVKKETP